MKENNIESKNELQILPNSLAKENTGIEIDDEAFAAAIGITFCVKNGFVYLQGEKHYAASNVEHSLWQQLRHSYGFAADGSCNALHMAQIERQIIGVDRGSGIGDATAFQLIEDVNGIKTPVASVVLSNAAARNINQTFIQDEVQKMFDAIPGNEQFSASVKNFIVALVIHFPEIATKFLSIAEENRVDLIAEEMARMIAEFKALRSSVYVNVDPRTLIHKLNRAFHLLDRAGSMFENGAPDETWFRDLYKLSGQFMICVEDEGWIEGARKVNFEVDAILDSVNDPDPLVRAAWDAIHDKQNDLSDNSQGLVDLESLAFMIIRNETTLSPRSRQRMIDEADRCAEGALDRAYLDTLNDLDLAKEYLGALRDYVNSQI